MTRVVARRASMRILAVWRIIALAVVPLKAVCASFPLEPGCLRRSRSGLDCGQSPCFLVNMAPAKRGVCGTSDSHGPVICCPAKPGRSRASRSTVPINISSSVASWGL